MGESALSVARSARGALFKAVDFDYESRIILGAAACGCGDVGLVLATLDRIADGDPQSWFDSWTATATPLLILDPADEQFFPGQARELYALVPGEKAIIEFSQAQGANFHCQPTGRRLTHTGMLDFLADHLPGAGAGAL